MWHYARRPDEIVSQVGVPQPWSVREYSEDGTVNFDAGKRVGRTHMLLSIELCITTAEAGQGRVLNSSTRPGRRSDNGCSKFFAREGMLAHDQLYLVKTARDCDAALEPRLCLIPSQ